MSVTHIDDYLELLANEGYRPTRDEAEPLIYFKAEGNRYRLQLFEGDADYIRLTSYWRLYDETTDAAAFQAVSETNRQLKFVKASKEPMERGVLFSWEALYKEPAHAAPFIERAISQLDSCAREFFRRVEASATATPAADSRETA
jgi:hypothetical protein